MANVGSVEFTLEIDRQSIARAINQVTSAFRDVSFDVDVNRQGLVAEINAAEALVQRNLKDQRIDVDVDVDVNQVRRQGNRAGDILTGIFQGVGQQITAGIGAAIGTGVGAAIGSVRGSFDAAANLTNLTNTLTQVTGSAAATAAELGFLNSTVDQLSLPLASAREGFTGIIAAARGTALEGQGARDVFEGIARASSALSLSSEETEGALLAIQQIISKGTVSAEELRGQLGERLPGAFQIAARSIGVTTAELDELLRKGEVTAEEFLPAFAQQLNTEFAQSFDSPSRAINRLQTQFTRVQETLGQALLPLIGSFTAGLSRVLEIVNQSDAFNILDASLKRFQGSLILSQDILPDVETAIVAFAENGAATVGKLVEQVGLFIQGLDREQIEAFTRASESLFGVLQAGITIAGSIVSVFSEIQSAVVRIIKVFNELQNNPVFRAITSGTLALSGGAGGAIGPNISTFAQLANPDQFAQIQTASLPPLDPISINVQSLNVSTPDPVANTAQILADFGRQQSRGRR